MSTGNGTSMYRRIGRVLTPMRPHVIPITSLGTTKTLGHTVAAYTGNKSFPVACVSSENGAMVRLMNVVVRERFESGTARKLPMRLMFFTAEVSATMDTMFYAGHSTFAGYYDILASDYIDLPDDATATNGAAVAIAPPRHYNGTTHLILPNGLPLSVGAYGNTLHVVPTVLVADATGFAASAQMEIELHIQEH